MKDLSDAAVALNETLARNGNALPKMLSRRGLSAYYPARGILGQSAEAAKSPINATIGTAFEEDGSPLCLECLESRIDVPEAAFLYAPSPGMPALRTCWRDMLVAKNPALRGKAFSLPVVTHALTHGLSVAGHLFVNPGDTLLVTDLFWGNYKLLFEQTWDGILDPFATFDGDGFNVSGLAAKLMEPGDRKILLLNFPNNPTGYAPTEAEAVAIRGAIAAAADAGKSVVVLLDDAYFGLVYESGIREQSLFADLADLHPNVLAVKLDGPTKEDYVWGFRVGFMTFGTKGADTDQYRALEAKASGIVRGSISNVSHIAQRLLLTAYQDPAYPLQKAAKKAVLQARYQRIKSLLREHPEWAAQFSPLPFNAGYFMCVKLHGADPETVRKRLLEAYGVGVIATSGVIRLAFSSVPLERLETLFTSLDGAVRDVRDRNA